MPSSAVLGAAATAMGMATAGSLAIEAIARSHPDRVDGATRWAVHVWWPVILVGTALLSSGPTLAPVLTAALSVQLLREFGAMALGPPDSALLRACLAVVPLHYGAMLAGLDALFFPLVLGWALFVLPVVRMASGGPEGFIDAVARSQWALLTMVLGLSHLPWLVRQDLGAFGGADVVAFLLLTTFSGDAMQWVWGKLLGRHKLVPKISPKKTWEGLIGGSLTVAVIGGFAAPFLGLSALVGALLGVVSTAVGLLGDLVISTLKRDVGVKDAGTLLPGQGGLLDRLDGLLFTLPVGAWAVVWLT